MKDATGNSVFLSAAGRLGTEQQPQPGHSAWKSVLLRPCIISICVTRATLLIGPLADDRSDWRKRVSGNYRKCHPIHLVIKVDTLVSRTEISVFFGPFRPSIHLSKLPCHHIFQLYSFQVITHPTKPFAPALNGHINTCLAISPCKQSGRQGVLLIILPTWSVSVHQGFTGVSQKGAMELSLSTILWCQYIPQNHLEVRSESLLPLLIVGNFHGAAIGEGRVREGGEAET